jgi:general transcription factor 3C polypeptide 2
MQYLAVSAHPPGSNYHKMGASLKGRGAIQIWCLVTASECEESSKPSYHAVRRSAKKALILKDGLQNGEQKSLVVVKPRGRPRKTSLMDETTKPRGRPRKDSLTDETHRAQVTEPKKLGRPRKKPNEEDACAKVPKKRGRPRKYAPGSNFVEEDEQLSSISFNLEGTETILALPPPPGSNSIEERHNVAAADEANSFPIVEPLDIALPLSVLYRKKCSKRRSKEKQSIQKPDFVDAENSIFQDITLNDCQEVEFNSCETECNAEAKLASSVCCKKEMQLPKLVFCLAHYGKVAWDIKWKPFATSSTSSMGYLAVLLGNGSLEVYAIRLQFLFSLVAFSFLFFSLFFLIVEEFLISIYQTKCRWEVPFPSTVQRLYRSNPGREEGTDPRFLKLKPVFRCSKLTFGNRQR